MRSFEPGRWPRGRRPDALAHALSILLPLLVYGAVAVLITWPLAGRLTTHVAGFGFGDGYEVVRQVWWAHEQIAHGNNPFDQPLLVYPDGFTSWLQWTQPLQYLPAALLAFVVSPLTAFNLTLLITLALDGLAGYALGLTLTGGRRGAALLGGLALMAFPALQGHLSVGHLGNLILWPAALAARSLWQVLMQGAGWRAALWGALWFGLAALGHVTQVTFVMFPLAAFLLLGALIVAPRTVIRKGEPLAAQPIVRALAMLALGGLLIAPFFLPLLSDEGRAELRGVAEGGRVMFSADALAFASPSPFGPLDDAGLAPDYARRVLGTNSAEGSAYLGVIALALAAVALAKQRGAWAWAVLALGAMLLSLGPLLKWQGEPVTLAVEDIETHVTLPWAFLEDLPVFDATRTPGRFNLTTGLAIGALVSLGSAALLDRVRHPAARGALVIALGALLLLDYQLFWPFPTDDARQPEYFHALARAEDVRAVLNVPADDLLAAKIGLYQQTIHGKPLIAGHTLRRSPQNPAILALLDRAALGGAEADWAGLRAEDAPALLSAAGADRVIVHKQFLDDAGTALNWLRAVVGPPEYEDERIAAFAVAVSAPLDSDTLLLAPGFEGWSAPVVAAGARVMFLADEGAWHVYSLTEQYGELVFDAAPYRTARPVSVALDSRLLAAWTLDQAAETIRLPLWIDAGFHTLTFAAPGGCTPYPFALGCWDDPALSAACAPADPPACLSAALGSPAWEPLAQPLPTDIRLAGGLRLRGYTLDVAERIVKLRLFWQADGPLAASYALFVHVADPATDRPLAQFDGYPEISTDEWTGGAQWVSSVRIALPDDLPPGEVALNLGWADPASGERLAVVGAPDGLIRLATITVPAE